MKPYQYLVWVWTAVMLLAASQAKGEMHVGDDGEEGSQIGAVSSSSYVGIGARGGTRGADKRVVAIGRAKELRVELRGPDVGYRTTSSLTGTTVTGSVESKGGVIGFTGASARTGTFQVRHEGYVSKEETAGAKVVLSRTTPVPGKTGTMAKTSALDVAGYASAVKWDGGETPTIISRTKGGYFTVGSGTTDGGRIGLSLGGSYSGAIPELKGASIYSGRLNGNKREIDTFFKVNPNTTIATTSAGGTKYNVHVKYMTESEAKERGLEGAGYYAMYSKESDAEKAFDGYDRRHRVGSYKEAAEKPADPAAPPAKPDAPSPAPAKGAPEDTSTAAFRRDMALVARAHADTAKGTLKRLEARQKALAARFDDLGLRELTGGSLPEGEAKEKDELREALKAIEDTMKVLREGVKKVEDAGKEKDATKADTDAGAAGVGLAAGVERAAETIKKTDESHAEALKDVTKKEKDEKEKAETKS